MLLGLPAGDGVKEATNNEKVRQLHKPSRTLLCIFLSCALPLALCEALGAAGNRSRDLTTSEKTQGTLL